jgi:hypothetical protein
MLAVENALKFFNDFLPPIPISSLWKIGIDDRFVRLRSFTHGNSSPLLGAAENPPKKPFNGMHCAIQQFKATSSYPYVTTTHLRLRCSNTDILSIRASKMRPY